VRVVAVNVAVIRDQPFYSSLKGFKIFVRAIAIDKKGLSEKEKGE
jgi:hypothetical protein